MGGENLFGMFRKVYFTENDKRTDAKVVGTR
jgi:hypothetical protein